MKIGRNDPCPCGSGRKYKKCCLYKPALVEVKQMESVSEQLTLDGAEQMETEAIFEMLQGFGIDSDRDSFIYEIGHFSSAEELLQFWFEKYHLDKRNSINDFAPLAIKVLAKRLVPDQLLLEELDDWMIRGYNFSDVNDSIHASLLWWKVWKHLPKWIGERKITSIEGLDEVTSHAMGKSFSDWAQDFELELANARLTDQQFIHMRRIYAEDFLELFPDSAETIIRRMTVAIGEALFHLGKIKEAENVFKEYVEKHPDNINLVSKSSKLQQFKSLSKGS